MNTTDEMLKNADDRYALNALSILDKRPKLLGSIRNQKGQEIYYFESPHAKRGSALYNIYAMIILGEGLYAAPTGFSFFETILDEPDFWYVWIAETLEFKPFSQL